MIERDGGVGTGRERRREGRGEEGRGREGEGRERKGSDGSGMSRE